MYKKVVEMKKMRRSIARRHRVVWFSIATGEKKLLQKTQFSSGFLQQKLLEIPHFSLKLEMYEKVVEMKKMRRSIARRQYALRFDNCSLNKVIGKKLQIEKI